MKSIITVSISNIYKSGEIKYENEFIRSRYFASTLQNKGETYFTCLHMLI